MSEKSDRKRLALVTNEITGLKFCASCNKWVRPTPKGLIRKRKDGHIRWICEHCAAKMAWHQQQKRNQPSGTNA